MALFECRQTDACMGPCCANVPAADLNDFNAGLDRLYNALYPAFESGMGDTLVREVDDQAADDPDALWLRAVRLQMVLDRIEGRA